METRICLPFDVDRGLDLPRGVVFSNLEQELPGADMLVCFGGDGTILHASKAATRSNVPVLGVNIGTVGFIAELESTELQLLRRIAAGEYEIERRKMLDVMVTRDGNVLQRETCLNDVVITKGAVARVVRLAVYCDQVQAMEFGGDGVVIATPTRLHSLQPLCRWPGGGAGGWCDGHHPHLRPRCAKPSHRDF